MVQAQYKYSSIVALCVAVPSVVAFHVVRERNLHVRERNPQADTQRTPGGTWGRRDFVIRHQAARMMMLSWVMLAGLTAHTTALAAALVAPRAAVRMQYSTEMAGSGVAATKHPTAKPPPDVSKLAKQVKGLLDEEKADVRIARVVRHADARVARVSRRVKQLEREKLAYEIALRASMENIDELTEALMVEEEQNAELQREVEALMLQTATMVVDRVNLKRDAAKMEVERKNLKLEATATADHAMAFRMQPTLGLLKHTIERDWSSISRQLKRTTRKSAMLMAKSTFSATSQCLGFAADLFVLACKPVDAASKLKWFHRVPIMWARDPARWARDGLPGITGADFQ